MLWQGWAQIRVLEVVGDTPGALVVSVESTLLRLRCAQCGFKCRRVHDRRAKRVRDLEVSGRRMTLVWQRRRMVCGNCASRFLEEHPAFEGALRAFVAANARVMTFSRRRAAMVCTGTRCAPSLGRLWSLSGAAAAGARCCWSMRPRCANGSDRDRQRRHRRTLAMVQHRSSAALSADATGPRWCKGVKVVVSDGSKAYKSAIDDLGHARHVLDRFHVIRWFAAGLTQPPRRAPP